MINPEPVVVIARWKTSEAQLGTVLELWKALRTQSLAEPGCLGYEAFEQVGERGALLLLERYRDEAAAEEHRNSAHYRELIERIRPLLADRHVEFLGLRNQ
jgi:quinol monooxygenase YgiN